MKLALGFDHGGYDLKKPLLDYLNKNNIEYIDFGTDSAEAVNYPIYAKKVADAVVAKQADFGILICGTGVGMSIVANKVKGIRCALANEVFTAKATRSHNDANVLAMGSRVIGQGTMIEIVDTFLNTPYMGQHHAVRVGMISKVENGEEL